MHAEYSQECDGIVDYISRFDGAIPDLFAQGQYGLIELRVKYLGELTLAYGNAEAQRAYAMLLVKIGAIGEQTRESIRKLEHSLNRYIDDDLLDLAPDMLEGAPEDAP